MAVTCPTCGSQFDEHAFTCPKCEAILYDNLFDDSTERTDPEEPTVVRRMLMPPDEFLEAPSPERPVTSPSVFDEKPTVESTLGAVVAPANGRPSLAPDIDLRDLQLTVFEAYVVSRVDGTSTLEQLRTALDLSFFEMQVVVATLQAKGVLEVRVPDLPARPAQAPPPPPPIPAASRPRAAGPAPHPAPHPAPRPVARPKKERDDGVDPHMSRHLHWMRAVGLVKKPNPLQEAIKLEQQGDLAGAIGLLEESIERSKDPAPLYNRLALVLIKERRDYDRAEELLEKAEKLDPLNKTYQSNLQKVLILKTKRGVFAPDR